MSARRVSQVALAVVISGFACTFGGRTAAEAQPVTQWSQFLGNPAHTSYAADPAIGATNAIRLGVKWMANLFSADLGSPVVAYNGVLQKEVVYVGDERGDLYALDAGTGQVIWSVNVGYGAALRDSPAVAPDGSVWIGTTFDATLYKIDGATGAVLCALKSPDNHAIFGSPMIVAPPGGGTSVYWDSVDNGTVGPVVGSNETSCAAMFDTKIVSGSWTTPAFGLTRAGRPLVVLGTADPASTVFALDALKGTVAWTYRTYRPPGQRGWDIGDAATISPPGNNGFADGVAYVSNEYGVETAIDLSKGTPIWTYLTYPANFHQKRYVIASAALDGNRLVYGYLNGVVSLNATTGAPFWVWNAPAGVDSSPAIVGQTGSEVVAFADLAGVFRVLSLGAGSQLYAYQTGGYVTASPAENSGTIYVSSSDGFLYAFAPGGGNGAKPAETIVAPANRSKIANPNGSLVISGGATGKPGVKAVEIAVQANGSSGPWYDAATDTWNPAPVRNEATLVHSSLGARWSYALPIAASGGSYEVFANAVSTANLVDKGSVAYFTVLPSTSEPTVKTSVGDVPPGSTFSAGGAAFQAGEKVTFTLFGKTVAVETADKNGRVAPKRIGVPSSATFGPTSLTLTGQLSQKSASATVVVTNAWTQFGYDALRTAQEPHDSVIAHTIFVGGSLLNVDWIYGTGAPVNTSPAVVKGIAYIANDAGVLDAIDSIAGAPLWSYAIPSKASIRSSPAVDPGGRVIFGANDGKLYVLGAGGKPLTTVALGGNLGSPAYAQGTVVVASSSGAVYALADPAWTTRWSANAGAPVSAAPVYDADAKLVVAGTSAGTVTAFDSATGAPAWSATVGGAVNGVLAADGSVYVASSDGNVHAYVEATGAARWNVAGDGTAVNALALDAQGGPAFGTAGGGMYDASPKGAVYYSRSYGTEPIAGLAGAETDEFGSTLQGSLQLLRTNDGGWQFVTGSTFGFGVEPVVVDGILYAGTNDGNLYAFTPQGYSPPPQLRVRKTMTMGR